MAAAASSSQPASELQQQLAVLTAQLQAETLSEVELQAALACPTGYSGRHYGRLLPCPRLWCAQAGTTDAADALCKRTTRRAGGQILLQTTASTLSLSLDQRQSLEVGLERIADLDKQIQAVEAYVEETASQLSTMRSGASNRLVFVPALFLTIPPPHMNGACSNKFHKDALQEHAGADSRQQLSICWAANIRQAPHP